jgi:hypothetical protein
MQFPFLQQQSFLVYEIGLLSDIMKQACRKEVDRMEINDL